MSDGGWILLIIASLLYIWLFDFTPKPTPKPTPTPTPTPKPKPSNNRSNSSKFTQEDEIILCLERALQKNKNVEIQYTKQNGERTIRTITPIMIEDYEGSNGYATGYICVRAYCHLRQANRTFMIHRIDYVCASSRISRR